MDDHSFYDHIKDDRFCAILNNQSRKSMPNLLHSSFLLIFLLIGIHAIKITVISPPQLSKQIQSSPLSSHISPIGFRPLSGRIDGRIMLSNPRGACSMISDVHSSDQDIFILADDSECLESIKAKNIANSGAYIGLIRQNINNTLHDKQINLVHIPIIELAPESYDKLVEFIEGNEEANVAISIDFTDHTMTHQINLEVWFSPTEGDSYGFMLDSKKFLQEHSSLVSFAPHYILQSQRQAKNYIGCFSSGRYCPSQIEFQGKYQGINIVDQTLRQIILWKISRSIWWKYIDTFYNSCLLKNPQIFKNQTQLTICSQNAMIIAGVDQQDYQQQYNKSFLGNKREVDDNTYLLQQRQKYVKEQISAHPIVLINKKEIELDLTDVKERICKLQGQKQIGSCISSHTLSTMQVFIILSVMILVFVVIAALYRLYIHLKMKKQIKSEVDRTLEQYYRYIDTFQETDGKKEGKKDNKPRENARKLNEDLQQENRGKGSFQLQQIEGK